MVMIKEIKIGSVFENLTVIEKVSDRYKNWICLCFCGKKRRFGEKALFSRHNTSCSCMAHQANRTHGLSSSTFYKRWDGIMRRCYRKSYQHFNAYGGRGIKCEWKSFDEFKDDMYESYKKHAEKYGEINTTIDRIDPNSNYCKENCRWATWDTQNNNRRNSIFFEVDGEKITATQLCKKLKIHRNKIHNLLRIRTKEEVTKMIGDKTIFKSSHGKKLELL